MDTKKKLKCRVCGITYTKKSLSRVFDLVMSLDGDYCKKCYMESKTEEDRTGRSSKKDKYKNKDDRTRSF